MGIQFTVEEEQDLTLPVDSIHRARLLEIKERTFEYTDKNDGSRKTASNLEWWWEITRPAAGLSEEFKGRRVRGECRPKITNRPGNKLREWAEALLDREIPVGMLIDTDDLVGLEAEIVIGHRNDRKDAAKVWEYVEGVLPAIGDSASEPPF